METITGRFTSFAEPRGRRVRHGPAEFCVGVTGDHEVVYLGVTTGGGEDTAVLLSRDELHDLLGNLLILLTVTVSKDDAGKVFGDLTNRLTQLLAAIYQAPA